MIFDFGKLKNSISYSCIFRKSFTSHTKLCNSVRHFHYRLGRAATAMQAQMSKIFGHDRFKAIFKGQTEAKDKLQVSYLGKQAFRECVWWISKQVIILSCDRIEPAAN